MLLLFCRKRLKRLAIHVLLLLLHPPSLLSLHLEKTNTNTQDDTNTQEETNTEEESSIQEKMSTGRDKKQSDQPLLAVLVKTKSLLLLQYVNRRFIFIFAFNANIKMNRDEYKIPMQMQFVSMLSQY